MLMKSQGKFCGQQQNSVAAFSRITEVDVDVKKNWNPLPPPKTFNASIQLIHHKFKCKFILFRSVKTTE